MAADMNSVNLVGRLTRDPEVRQTAGGTSVASLRLAVTSRVNRGGEWSDQANYFDVVAFGRQAENAEKYLTKGRRIGVSGRLSWREWESQDGSKRQSVEVVANDLFFLDSARDGQAQQPSSAAGRNDLPPTPAARPGMVDDDDVPF